MSELSLPLRHSTRANSSRQGARPVVARQWSREAQRALVASVANEGNPRKTPGLAQLVPACDPTELVDLVIAEGIAGAAQHRLAALLPDIQRSRLSRLARRDAAVHLSSLASLNAIAQSLEAAGVAWVVLKGPVLAELAYKPSARGYTDLDIMVAPHQFETAARALGEAGATLADEDWQRLVAQAKGQMGMVNMGRSIDLHWHLVYLRSARERWRIPTDELLERRRPLALGPVKAWALDPTDFAAHITLHASFAGAQQLRRLLDIERTLANQPPDWDVLERRCHAWKIGLPVSVMLNRAQVTLGAQVPAGVVHHLGGSNLGRFLVRELGRWVPAGHMPGGRSVTNGMMRSLRDGVVPTGVEFAAETWRTLGKLATAARQGPGYRPYGVNAQTSGLDAYLEMVARSDRFGHLHRPGAQCA